MSACVCVALVPPALAQNQPVPASVAEHLLTAARDRGPGALLQALDRALTETPALAATPGSAAALAEAAAAPVSEFRGANIPVYRDIANRIIAAAPSAVRPEVAKAVVAAVTRYASADARVAAPPPKVALPAGPGETFVPPEMKPTKTVEKTPPLGVTVGSFLLIPEVQVAEFYDNNIYATGSSKKSDFVNVISPHLLLQSRWARHELNFEAHFDRTQYRDHGSEDSTDYRVNSEGRYDFSKDTNAYGGLLYSRSHEDRESPDDVNGITPTIYHEGRAYAGASHTFSRWVVRGGGTFERIAFRDTDTTLGTINNRDRDRNHITFGGHVGYALTPVFSPYAEVTGDLRRYDERLDDNGYARNSNGYRVNIGSRLTLPGRLDADAYVGYMGQNYTESRFSTVSAAAYGGNLRWRALPATLVTTYVDRSIEETTLFGSSGYVYTGIGATVEETLTPDLLLTLRGSYGRSKFQDIARTDNDYDTGFGLRYLVSRNFYVAGDYRYQVRHSSVDTADYNRNQFFLRVGAQY